MSASVLSPVEFACALGLSLDAEGAVAGRGMADLARMPQARWGLTPRREIVRYVRHQLEAAQLWGEPTGKQLGEVLDRLVALGESEEVFLEDVRHIAPGSPRWVRTGKDTGALLSVDEVPPDVELLTPMNQNDLVRRVRAQGPDDVSALAAGGAVECSFRGWLGAPTYLIHARRRLRRSVRVDRLSLAEFWGVLTQALNQEGAPLGEDADVRALSGPPGAYFGRHSSEGPEGRWRDATTDGVWCGYRRGYGDSHWHPIILRVHDGDRRALDLYDHDEWRWALLARALACGQTELMAMEGQICRLTFPLPAQMEAGMDLLGPRVGAWRWALSEGAPDPVWISGAAAPVTANSTRLG